VATVMPFFNEFPNEAAIVGRLLTGYGELELELAQCVGAATGDVDAAIRALFVQRWAEARIRTAGKLAEKLYDAAGLGDDYRSTVDDMDCCRLVRNQYAHCHWYPRREDGLGFVNLEDIAKNAPSLWPLDAHRHLVDRNFLEKQEEFFLNVRHWFWYLSGEYKVKVSAIKGHIWVSQPRLPHPALHGVTLR
jgi:hypothetical protein